MRRRPLSFAFAFVLALGVASACKPEASARTRAQLDELQKKKDEAAKAKKEEKLAPAPVEVALLDPPYNDASSVIINADGPCPEGLWALFPEVPGETKEEKKANQAKKKELERELREKQFLIKLRGPGQVTLKPYDAPKGLFPLEVLGTIDCVDAAGRVALAWTAARAGDPGNSAMKEGAEVTQNMWLAPLKVFELPVKTMAEAKEFKDKNALSLSARVVFKLGKAEVDRKIRRLGKVTEKAAGETISIGGGDEDWGAGRLVRAQVVGLRVAAEKEKKQLFEVRDGK